MPKRKAKKNLKKRVHKKVQKLKELTAQDLLMNPTLLQSPQFKALPIEKQFQLTSQLKQLKMMMNRPMGGVVSASGGGDSSLYHRLMDVSNQVAKKEKENKQLEVELTAANTALRQQKQLEKDIKRLKQSEKEKINTEAKIDDLTNELNQLKFHNADERVKSLIAQIEQAKQESNQERLTQLQREFAKANAEHKQLLSIIGGEGRKRIQSERIRKQKQDKIETQAAFQNQINNLTENGKFDKADDVEQDLNSIPSNDEINEDIEGVAELREEDDQLKKKLIDDECTVEDEEEQNSTAPIVEETEQIPAIPLSDIETNGIEAEVIMNNKIKTKNELVKDAQTLLDKKQQNQRQIERIISENNNEPPLTINTQIDIEDYKADLLKQLDTIIANEQNPNYEYLQHAADKIEKGNTFKELKILSEKLKLDKQNQETLVKQREVINKKKAECYDKLSDAREQNIGFNFPFNLWQLKLSQASTPDQLLEIERYINIANDAYKTIANDKKNQLQSSNDPNEKDIAKAKVDEATEQLIKVQEFLNKPYSPHKLTVYYDSTKEQEFSPKTRTLRPSNDYEYIDISKYRPDHNTNPIPNEVLLNGINLYNLAQRIGLSTEKGKFIASLSYKLACASAKIGKAIAFELLKFGRDLVIAAIPAAFNFAAKNPKLTAGALGGWTAWKGIQRWWNSERTEQDLVDALDSVEQDRIVNLTKEQFDKEVQKKIDDHTGYIHSSFSTRKPKKPLTAQQLLDLQNAKTAFNEAQIRKDPYYKRTLGELITGKPRIPKNSHPSGKGGTPKKKRNDL